MSNCPHHRLPTDSHQELALADKSFGSALSCAFTHCPTHLFVAATTLLCCDGQSQFSCRMWREASERRLELNRLMRIRRATAPCRPDLRERKAVDGLYAVGGVEVLFSLSYLFLCYRRLSGHVSKACVWWFQESLWCCLCSCSSSSSVDHTRRVCFHFASAFALHCVVIDELLGWWIVAGVVWPEPWQQLRLPDRIAPAHYESNFTIDLQQSTFRGRQRIHLITPQPFSSDFIWLHALDMDVTRARLVVGTSKCRLLVCLFVQPPLMPL
jgi:hypothetical protein